MNRFADQDGHLGPFPLPGNGGGNLEEPDRQAIFVKTGCSCSTRHRASWRGRRLSASGPPHRLQEALQEADRILLEQQSRNEGPAYVQRPPTSRRRVSEDSGVDRSQLQQHQLGSRVKKVDLYSIGRQPSNRLGQEYETFEELVDILHPMAEEHGYHIPKDNYFNCMPAKDEDVTFLHDHTGFHYMIIESVLRHPKFKSVVWKKLLRKYDAWLQSPDTTNFQAVFVCSNGVHQGVAAMVGAARFFEHWKGCEVDSHLVSSGDWKNKNLCIRGCQHCLPSQAKERMIRDCICELMWQ